MPRKKPPLRKKLRPTRLLAIRCPTDLAKSLDAAAARHSLTRTKIIELALRRGLPFVEGKNADLLFA